MLTPHGPEIYEVFYFSLLCFASTVVGEDHENRTECLGVMHQLAKE